MWGIIATWCMAYDGINKASEMLKNDDDAGNAIEEAIKLLKIVHIINLLAMVVFQMKKWK